MSYSLSQMVYDEKRDEYDLVSLQEDILTEHKLLEVFKIFQQKDILLCDMLITEYDDEDIDAYGCPELIQQINAEEWIEWHEKISI